MYAISRPILRMPGVIGVFVCSREGLPVATAFIAEAHVDLLCAMAAVAFAEAEGTLRRVGLGQAIRCTFQSRDGLVMLLAADEFILGVETSGGVNLGLLKMEMQTCALQINTIVAPAA